MTKLGFVEQLTELPEFPSGSVEHKMCKKIAELTQVSLKNLFTGFTSSPIQPRLYMIIFLDQYMWKLSGHRV